MVLLWLQWWEQNGIHPTMIYYFVKKNIVVVVKQMYNKKWATKKFISKKALPPFLSLVLGLGKRVKVEVIKMYLFFICRKYTITVMYSGAKTVFNFLSLSTQVKVRVYFLLSVSLFLQKWKCDCHISISQLWCFLVCVIQTNVILRYLHQYLPTGKYKLNREQEQEDEKSLQVSFLWRSENPVMPYRIHVG